MRAIGIESLQGEELLGRNVYDEAGRILLTSGTKIRKAYIDKLKTKGYYKVYVEDEISAGIEVDDIISEKTRKKSKEALKSQFSNYLSYQDVDIDTLLDCVNDIIDDVLKNNDIILNISDIRTKDEYTFAHSVSVCALAVSVGVNLNINHQRLKELAIGSLLHDLGKILVPSEVLNKPSKLTSEEFEMIKKHPRFGYDILNKKHQITPISKNIVLMHHEKCNGIGYPLGVDVNQIHELTRLVTICDMYDAMTSDRPYRKGMRAYEVIEYLSALTMNELDKSMLQKFKNHVAVYPSGTLVKLNNGYKGIISRQNKGFLVRPIVRLLEDESGKRVLNNKEVDLTKELTVFIETIIEE